MSKSAVGSIVCALFCLNVSIAHAGPCSAYMAQFKKAIRDPTGDPFAGLSAPQSVAAPMERQPTLESIKRAQNCAYNKILRDHDACRAA